MSAAIDLCQVQQLDSSRADRVRAAAEQIAEGLLCGEVFELGQGLLLSEYGLDDVLALYMEPVDLSPSEFDLALAALLSARTDSERAEAATLYTQGLRATALRLALRIADLKIN